MCTGTEEEYSVYCVDCDQVWQPPKGSKLWWMAKQYHRTYPTRLDAMQVPGEQCGCKVIELRRPNTLYRVFGYNDLCEDFDHYFDKFTDAVRFFREKNSDPMTIVFIQGVSSRVVGQIKLNQLTQDDEE